MISGARAPVAGPMVSHEGSRIGNPRHLYSWHKSFWIKVIGFDPVLKVGHFGERDLHVPEPKGFEDLGVADVVSGGDGTDGDPKGEAPGKERLSGGDRLDGKTMSLQDITAQIKSLDSVAHPDLGGQGAHGNGHVVSGHGQPCDLIELMHHRASAPDFGRELDLFKFTRNLGESGFVEGLGHNTPGTFASKRRKRPDPMHPQP